LDEENGVKKKKRRFKKIGGVSNYCCGVAKGRVALAKKKVYKTKKKRESLGDGVDKKLQEGVWEKTEKTNTKRKNLNTIKITKRVHQMARHKQNGTGKQTPMLRGLKGHRLKKKRGPEAVTKKRKRGKKRTLVIQNFLRWDGGGVGEWEVGGD